MLLIEVFLKLWELIQVPVFLPQPLTWIAELSSTSTPATTESGWSTAIAVD